ncbi:CDK5RAP3-like protein [Eumeta japonica]|uniref:CDK5RAP3-like protein n=1 Tax=Eumeta variegata TaxID=151549 RepID=A0A4C1TBP4_EUMVA|nr:CDK5RAP3-like protein [Eumeta japonica]
MAKLEQQSDESLKRSQDLNKPEAQLLAEHNGPLQQLGSKQMNVNEIDFGDDNGGASSTISGEMIDFGELSIDNDAKVIDFGDANESGDIDWV